MTSVYAGFFTGELDALETDIEANHTTWEVFQGRKHIGELVEVDIPAAAIMLENARRDPKDPNFGWEMDVTVTYIKYDPNGETYDALTNLEALIDEIDSFYETDRDISGNLVHGHFVGIDTWSKPKDNGFVFGFVIRLMISKNEPD
jgi:hypothetical protein